MHSRKDLGPTTLQCESSSAPLLTCGGARRQPTTQWRSSMLCRCLTLCSKMVCQANVDDVRQHAARARSSFSFLLSLSLSPFPSLPLPFRPPISLHLPSFVLYMQNTCLTTLHLSSSAAKLRPLIPLLIHLPHLAGQEFCKLFTSILERQLADAKDSEQNIMHQYVVTLMTYPLRFFLFCYFEDTDRVHPPPPPMTGCRNYPHQCSSPFGSNLPHLC